MSKTKNLDALAGEYVLGTLDEAERSDFESRLDTDRAAMRAVRDWEASMQVLAAGEDKAPPASVWAGISAGLRDDPAGWDSYTLRAGSGDWEIVSPGVAIKVLHEEKDTGMRSVILRMDAGARIESHPHSADEECLVLSGDVTFGGKLTLHAGDFHLARAGWPHPSAESKKGCQIYIRQRAA